MPGDFTEDCMALILGAADDSLDVLGGQYVGDVKESLDISVQYPGPIRSQPGERPRRETGELQDATSHEVERLLFDEVALDIVNDCPHGPHLEYGTAGRGPDGVGAILPRPFMAPAFERLTERLPEDLPDAMAGRL
jgi:hypothetical protein